MNQIKLIRLFISCPSDIVDEIESIKSIIEETNKLSGKQNSFRLEFINWKQDTFTDVGIDGQDVINRQVEDNYDILVGIIWQKLGTPTLRDISGTVEEINNAIRNINKNQLVYFKTKTPDNLNDINIEELQRIKKYKEDLQKLGVLYKEFSSVDEFEVLFRLNINELITSKYLISQIQKNTTENKLDDYSEILSLITDVENKNEEIYDIDILEFVESTTITIDEVTKSLTAIGDCVNNLTITLNKSTDELNKTNRIKDNRLRLELGGKIATHLSEDINIFNNKIELEIKKLSENLNAGIQLYSKAIVAAEFYSPDSIEELIRVFIVLKSGMKSSVENCAKMLQAVISWPPINSKFNKSKRNTEIVLKDLTKVILDGLILIEEIFKQHKLI